MSDQDQRRHDDGREYRDDHVRMIAFEVADAIAVRLCEKFKTQIELHSAKCPVRAAWRTVLILGGGIMALAALVLELVRK